MFKHQILNKVVDNGVVAVVRANTKEQAESIVEACHKGGLLNIELTFTVPGVVELIESLINKYEGTDVIIGAGTVINEVDCKKAIDAGAKFIVGPGFDEDVLETCKSHQIPYIPGCMTITEMMNVTKKGCEIVKLFPGSSFGPGFIKDVKGPLPDIKIMPTGGVDLDNAADWIKAGAVSLGIGSKLTYPAKTGDYDKITELARAFVLAVELARK